jgi:hypothetical protein
MGSIRNAFKMPSPMNVAGRSSSITAAFVASIIPRIEPTDDEISIALDILEMSPSSMKCAYCGSDTTEWNHFHALVENKAPTGYISEIRNLVPSCGKCNQSKGNKNWKSWMISNAHLSPKSRNVPNLEKKIKILEKYEEWGDGEPLDLESIADPALWKRHWNNHQHLLDAMSAAQSQADELRASMENLRPGFSINPH